MAKFEIEAKIGANSAEFERKMKAASRESKEFAKSVHENMSQVKDIFNEVAGEAGLGKLTGALTGGAVAAAAAFGAAVVAACVEGVQAFAKLEDQAFKFGQILHDKPKGEEMAKWIEELPGHMGNKEQLGDAGVSLLEAYKALGDSNPLEKAQAMMLMLANASAQTGESIASMAEKYRNFVSGGEEAQKNGAKLAKGIPQISAMLKSEGVLTPGEEEGNKREISALKFQLTQTPAGAAKEDIAGHIKELEKLNADYEQYKKTGKRESVQDELKKFTPRELDRLMNKEFGPGGPSSNAANEKGDTATGKLEDVAATIERIKSAFGEGEMTAVKGFLNKLNSKEGLDGLLGASHDLGAAFGKLIEILQPILDMHQHAVDSGEQDARQSLEAIGMRFDKQGNPLALTPAQRSEFDKQRSPQDQLQAGHPEPISFGGSTKGQGLVLSVLNKIEQNTAKDGDVQ